MRRPERYEGSAIFSRVRNFFSSRGPEAAAQVEPIAAGRVAVLLLVSGFAALVMQTVWLREFRLIFGSSTASSAAVIAIFMGGLGFGSLVIGRRVDRAVNPLLVYAVLELTVAISAAVTPLLVLLVRLSYIQLGVAQLDPLIATTLRLISAALVLLIPTFCMGGSLPAAARCVETQRDVGRGHLGLLYGMNAIGAVAGAAVSTFFLLELLGNRKTLWVACLINSLVALVAWSLARRATTAVVPSGSPSGPEQEVDTNSPVRDQWRAPVVFAAAALVGFAFFLMEIVWYRMLGPLLGGSTFTFGLILAVALAGIGAGGAVYGSTIRQKAIGFGHFAATVGFEAFFVALPFFLGDRIAIFALLLRPLEAFGFSGHVIGWTLVTVVVVFPAAFVAGIQFPVLIAILGAGRTEIGRHVGLAYLWNTVGAIAGALVGGFGILPYLSAPGAWRMTVGLLAVLSVVFVIIAPRREPISRRWLPIMVSILAVLMIMAPGPSASWRHSGIGAGRAGKFEKTPNGLRAWANDTRRTIIWEEEGVEGSVALDASNGLAFVINGKIDGNTIGDRSTQVMSGLLGSILHPSPENALVIGLGTGSSAGWLGQVPSIDYVDVVELEPAIIHVARVSAPVNASVLENRKVRIHMGDAREWILTTPSRYDVIFSEPSNPYRAGIASLFTREFYQSVSDALSEEGIFIQWLQAYEVSPDTVRSVYATLGTTFPEIQTWRTNSADLLLIASESPIEINPDRLRRQISAEPYASALLGAWRVTDLEGFLAHFVANSSFSEVVVDAATEINTDDRNPIEFAFARMVGGSGTGFGVNTLAQSAIAANADRPHIGNGSVDWQEVEIRRSRDIPFQGSDVPVRIKAGNEYGKQNYAAVARLWKEHRWEPYAPDEVLMIAESLARTADDEARPFIERLRQWFPIEADIILGQLHWEQGRATLAIAAFSRAFVAYRDNPWPNPKVVLEGTDTALEIARKTRDEGLARRLQKSLEEPFSLYSVEDQRLMARHHLIRLLDPQPCQPELQELFHEMEPHVPWSKWILATRAECYGYWDDPLAERAVEEFYEFIEAEPAPFPLAVPD